MNEIFLLNSTWKKFFFDLVKEHIKNNSFGTLIGICGLIGSYRALVVSQQFHHYKIEAFLNSNIAFSMMFCGCLILLSLFFIEKINITKLKQKTPSNQSTIEFEILNFIQKNRSWLIFVPLAAFCPTYYCVTKFRQLVISELTLILLGLFLFLLASTHKTKKGYTQIISSVMIKMTASSSFVIICYFCFFYSLNFKQIDVLYYLLFSGIGLSLIIESFSSKLKNINTTFEHNIFSGILVMITFHTVCLSICCSITIPQIT